MNSAFLFECYWFPLHDCTCCRVLLSTTVPFAAQDGGGLKGVSAKATHGINKKFTWRGFLTSVDDMAFANHLNTFERSDALSVPWQAGWVSIWITPDAVVAPDRWIQSKRYLLVDCVKSVAWLMRTRIDTAKPPSLWTDCSTNFVEWYIQQWQKQHHSIQPQWCSRWTTCSPQRTCPWSVPWHRKSGLRYGIRYRMGNYRSDWWHCCRRRLSY